MDNKKSYKKLFDEKQCCVIIPTYNNCKTLKNVIDNVAVYTNNIIIVNDGSTDNTSLILNEYKNYTVYSLPENKGKGMAIRCGFTIAMEKGYKYAITIDSDGQHYPNEITKFIDVLDINYPSIIIGKRNLSSESVPGKSSLGNKFSNFWFKIETGVKIDDSQSGFRLYPLEKIKDIKILTTRYDFEIEVLVKSSWIGIDMISIPISVYYPPQKERVSHFRPFVDFFRISILNTLLCFIAFFWIKPLKKYNEIRKMNFKTFIKIYILNSNDSNLKIALSVMVGIFMGIIPLWGWQLVIAISLAITLKLNKFIVIVTANISIPPMIPIILFLSYLTGGIILGENTKTISYSTGYDFVYIKNNILQYIIGSISLAIIASVSISIITFIILSIFRNNINKQNNGNSI